MAVTSRAKSFPHIWYAEEAEQAARWWRIVPAALDDMIRAEDPARSKKVTDALLKMVKLDIAALEEAYRS